MLMKLMLFCIPLHGFSVVSVFFYRQLALKCYVELGVLLRGQIIMSWLTLRYQRELEVTSRRG